MSLAVLHSRALAGMDAPAVSVEVHLAKGLPSFTIVGSNLPDQKQLLSDGSSLKPNQWGIPRLCCNRGTRPPGRMRSNAALAKHGRRTSRPCKRTLFP